uniref:Uncharacterized protein n=1 Tax=Cucumis melo TaxID=3656 RepID=A0A9I9DMW6_CUCME
MAYGGLLTGARNGDGKKHVEANRRAREVFGLQLELRTCMTLMETLCVLVVEDGGDEGDRLGDDEDVCGCQR